MTEKPNLKTLSDGPSREIKEFMKRGGIFTIDGVYKRRTFWQWLTRQPRELRRFRTMGRVND